MGEHEIIKETIRTIVMIDTIDTIELPENATNGDMIKAMFPNIESIDAPLNKIYVYVYTKDHKCMRFDSDWWNAPYKRG